MDSNSKSVEYINSTDYSILSDRIKKLEVVINDQSEKLQTVRKLRFADIDIDSEREQGRILPDELYIPQHIVDTNIRREQPGYVQFDTQSPRAVICSDNDDLAFDLSLLEKDLTKKLRYSGWQLARFSNIDGLQANGYGVMEVIYDQTKPGEIASEYVQYGDFAFLLDTRNIQDAEMVCRVYYFSKTKLLDLCGDPTKPSDADFSRSQVEKILDTDPASICGSTFDDSMSNADRSLYPLKKVMFRVGGIVHVGWAYPNVCDSWVRMPRPLYIGRRELLPMPNPQQMLQNPMALIKNPMALMQTIKQLAGGPPPSKEVYETDYPYIIYPYLISENDTISQYKGRAYLDQYTQEAVTSLTSSLVTKTRRSAGLYASKNSDDPNDDLAMQRNTILQNGKIMNSKITFFELSPPDPSSYAAVQALTAANQNETSQVNFAVNNRKDSRKTAKEIEVAQQQASLLSTVQVVLYSISSCEQYTLMVDIIVSRVKAGLIKVDQKVRPLYERNFTLKPSGDVDVIEKQQLIQSMTSAWPVIQNTAAAPVFMGDLIEMMFPVNSAKYLQAIQQAQQQAQSQQAQQAQQMQQMLSQLGQEIVYLSKHADMFSDTGRIHAFPKVEYIASQIEQIQQQVKQQTPLHK